ncbi:MAG: efflux transporter outer membrane subunit [Pseudomonadota bacterium]|nr:efflux transporter outer membrane subunit [Pseudomonadota bacterium]
MKVLNVSCRFLLFALALAGCATAPPDRIVQPSPDFARAQHAASIRLARDGWPDARWWTRYDDPQLNALVARALQDSPGMAVAATRIGDAQAVLASTRSVGGGSLGLEMGVNRQRYSGNGFFPAPIGGSFYNDAAVQVKASYDFDWWGKQRALVAASLGEVNARLADAAQAETDIAASVVQSYLRLQMLWARRANTLAMAALAEAMLADRRVKIAHGLATADARTIIERDLATLDEQAAAFATQAGREQEALRALVGAGADNLQVTPHAIHGGAASLPTTLGLALLARRPDLQAARWRVEATLGRVTANQAAYYPDLNLTGAFGLDATSLGKLLRYDSRTMVVGTVIDLPLFHSRALDANLDSARAGRNAAIADYNQAVLRAVAEVAEEGATLQGLAVQVAAQARTLAASGALVDSSKRRIDHGLGERGTLLDARLALLHQQDTALYQQDAALQTEVALTKALGGGYVASIPNSSK